MKLSSNLQLIFFRNCDPKISHVLRHMPVKYNENFIENIPVS